MPLTVDPITHVISIPLSYLTLVSAGLYDCDTNQVRLDLRVWEATEEGRAEPKTHVHAPAFTVAGSTLAPGFKLVNDYSVEFEDGNHSVRLKNTNNNLFDVADNRLVKNNVLVIPGNSFGLVQVTSGSGVTAQDKTDIAVLVESQLADDFAGVTATVDNAAIALAVEAQLANEFNAIPTSVQIAAAVDIVLADNFAAIPTQVSVTDKEDIATRVEAHLINEADGQTIINAIVGAIGNTNVDEVALVAAVRADLERAGGTLKLMEADLNNPDQYKADVSNLSADVNVVQVAGIAVTGINDFKANLTGLPTAAQIRAEIDTNSTKLASILQDTEITIPDLIAALNVISAAIKTKTDQLNFTKVNEVDVNVKSQNSATMLGTGVNADKWRGA